jgi:hypothetical protein
VLSERCRKIIMGVDKMGWDRINCWLAGRIVKPQGSDGMNRSRLAVLRVGEIRRETERNIAEDAMKTSSYP